MRSSQCSSRSPVRPRCSSTYRELTTRCRRRRIPAGLCCREEDVPRERRARPSRTSSRSTNCRRSLSSLTSSPISRRSKGSSRMPRSSRASSSCRRGSPIRRTSTAAGEVVVPEGMQEITIALPVERVVGGAVTAGSYVGVVLHRRIPSESGRTTQTAETQFMFHRMLVTRVTPGTTLSTSDSTEDQPSPGSAFMVTLAATTPQVEKLAYGAEQQEDGNGGIWLTLEPENADQSGSSVATGRTSSRDSIPAGQPQRGVRDPAPPDAPRRLQIVPGEYVTFGAKRGGRPRRGSTSHRVARSTAELRGDERAQRRTRLSGSRIGLIVVREQRSDLEDWVDGIEIHAVLSPEASDSTSEALLDRLDGWLTASGRLPEAARLTTT